jgi:hypothetical protein
MEALLFNPLLTALLWMLVYFSDRMLTIYTVRLFNANIKKYAEYEGGMELTPLWRKEVAEGRWISLRFVVLLALTGGIVYLIGALFQDEPYFYELFLGGWLLLEAAIHIRHVRNITTYWNMAHTSDVQGFIRYPLWLSYRVSAVEMLVYFVFFLALFILFRRMFFLGGTVAALGLAIFHWFLGARARKTSKRRQPAEGR